MPSGGLMALAGIAEGLKQGFLTYQDVKRYKDQKEFQDKQSARQDAALGLQAKEKGLIYNPDATDGTGMIGETPLYQKQQKVAEQTAGTQLEEGSPEGIKAKDEVSRGLLKQAGMNVPIPAGVHFDPKSILPEAMKVKAAQASANVKYTNANTKQMGIDQTKTYDAIQSDPQWLAADKEVNSAKTLLNLVDDAVRNPKSAQALGAYGARYITGDKRITDTEIKTMGGSGKGVMNQLRQAVQNIESGTITPQSAEFMRQFIKATLPTAEAVKEEREDSHTSSFARHYGLDADEASLRVLGKPTSFTRKKQSGGGESQGLVKTEGTKGKGPEVGKAYDGHVYLGGDPNKKESWRAE